MPYKIIPCLVYICDNCPNQVEVIFKQATHNGLVYQCPQCEKKIILPAVELNKNIDSIDTSLLSTITSFSYKGTINKKSAFLIGISKCDSYTSNYIFHTLKIALHAARAQQAVCGQNVKLSETINHIEDLLLEMRKMPGFDSNDTYPDIMINQNKYSKFISKKNNKKLQ